PTPMHIVASARLPPRTPSSSAAVRASRAPDMPSGWPRAMAPPFGLTKSASSGSPSWRRQASAWAANASLSSITSNELTPNADPRRVGHLRPRRHWADTHDARRDAGGRHAGDTGQRLQVVLLDRTLRGDQQGGRPVVDSGRIAGGDRAVLAEQRRQGGELLQR